MSTRTITATVNAWLSEYNNPVHLLDPNTPAVRAVTMPVFARTDSDPKGWQKDGYTLVGSAEITLTLVSEREVVKNKVTALRAEQMKTLADAQAKATQIESQIQKLLAITYEPGSGS